MNKKSECLVKTGAATTEAQMIDYLSLHSNQTLEKIPKFKLGYKQYRIQNYVVQKVLDGVALSKTAKQSKGMES